MNRLALTTALLLGFSASSALAISELPKQDFKPTLSLGFSFALGGSSIVDTGISLRLLSTNEADHAAATAGVTYYLGSGTFGADIGAAYNLNEHMSSAFTYDFLKQGAVFSLSGANLKKERKIELK